MEDWARRYADNLILIHSNQGIAIALNASAVVEFDDPSIDLAMRSICQLFNSVFADWLTQDTEGQEDLTTTNPPLRFSEGNGIISATFTQYGSWNFNHLIATLNTK